MTEINKNHWRKIVIPFRIIDKVYGADNYDNAGDEIDYCITQIEEYPGQYVSKFELDTSHDNPWYHSMEIKVRDIPSIKFNALVKLIKELKLQPEIAGN